jgi:hypothetical protein
MPLADVSAALHGTDANDKRPSKNSLFTNAREPAFSGKVRKREWD